MELTKSAYRESGKVVFAYLHGFSCDGIEFTGEQFDARLNFKNMAPEFAAVVTFEGKTAVADKLFEPGLATTTFVPQILTRILYAGAIAVAQFTESGDTVISEITPNSHDMAILSNVDKFLSTYSKGLPPEEFRNLNLHLAWIDIQNEEKLWATITAMANAIVSLRRDLSRKEINTILA